MDLNRFMRIFLADFMTLQEEKGRTTRIWLDLILKHSLKECVDWSQINKKEYLDAIEQSVYDSTKIKFLLKKCPDR